MIDSKEKPYPGPMLPGVDYQKFDENADDFESILNLEYGVLEHCQSFLGELERVLLSAKMIQVPELIISHLCAYLGIMAAVYGGHKAYELSNTITEIIEKHAALAYVKFNQYLQQSAMTTPFGKKDCLEKLKDNTPGSIVVQTLRLGKNIMDMMNRLDIHRDKILKYPSMKQNELFCPQPQFFDFVIPLVNDQHQHWIDTLDHQSTHFALNQFSIQIAWLIGYFSYLDHKPPNQGRYLEYALPCLTLYSEMMNKLLQNMYDKGQVLSSMESYYEEISNSEPQVTSLLKEIHDLSSKTHSAIPPAITDFEKETAIFQAGLEKLLIELMMEDMAVKVILMSVFYFWFTLDAPLRFSDPNLIDKHCAFDHMGNIIALVKSTTATLVKPKFSPNLTALNEKMQSLKAHLPHPSTLDHVPQDTIVYQSEKVNTAIHSFIGEYLNKNYNIEVITNVLFSQWMRLSVFYGISESEWQKMDYYFEKIITTVRSYLSTLK